MQQDDAEITRDKMALMIVRSLSLADESNVATGFPEDRDTPALAKGAVAALKKLGLVKGKSANKFDADAKATREEVVKVLLWMQAKMGK